MMNHTEGDAVLRLHCLIVVPRGAWYGAVPLPACIVHEQRKNMEATPNQFLHRSLRRKYGALIIGRGSATWNPVQG